MNFVDYYAVLGISCTSTLNEIKKAYRRLAKTLHPDVGGSVEKMTLINEAYDILSKPEKKSQYDNQLFRSTNTDAKNNTEQFQQKSQEKASPVYNKNRRNSNNPKFHRTKLEKHMSSEFLLRYSSEIKKYEDNIYCSKAYDKTKSIAERIKACDKSIQSYYDFQKFCYSFDGGTIYFQDHWEYCHNSHNECFSFVETLEQQKENLQKQNKKAVLLEDLENDLYELIKMEQPILQSLLFKYYDVSIKNDIKKILNEWESYDAIKRTKCKNSYMIELL